MRNLLGGRGVAKKKMERNQRVGGEIGRNHDKRKIRKIKKELFYVNGFQKQCQLKMTMMQQLLLRWQKQM